LGPRFAAPITLYGLSLGLIAADFPCCAATYFPKGFFMFKQIQVTAIRLSLFAALLVTAAVVAGWKWNRPPL
jgi:hypothetical protein